MYFGCLYISAFPAWVFERVDLAAHMAPVVVIASAEVVGASPRLRSAGIVEGISADRAERLAPEGTLFRRRDAQLEQAAWEDVLHEINIYTPFLEPDVPGRVYFKPFEGVRELVERLRARVAFAPHRTTALLGALRAAEGNVLAIRARHVRAFHDRFEVSRLAVLGFSELLIEQLALFGFDTLGAARELAHRHLQAQFGEEGVRFYRLLHPQDNEPMSLYTPPPSVRRAYEFDHPCTEPGDILPALEFLTRQAAGELKDNGAQRVKVMLHDRLRPSAFTCRVLPEASNDPRRLFNAAKTLIGGVLERGCRIQAIELELGSLRAMKGAQGSLFFRRPAAERAIQVVHRRYPDVLRRPSTMRDAVFEEERARLETIGRGLQRSIEP